MRVIRKFLAIISLLTVLFMVQAAHAQLSKQAQAKAEKAKARINAKVESLKQSGISLLPEMVSIPAGSFQMGSNSGDFDEKPAHSVVIKSFKLASTETTQQLWLNVMGENASRFNGSNRPVEGISWNDVQEFIAVLNKATGQVYRLPTEAEWEYAARSGTTTNYHWGNVASKRKANFNASYKEGTTNVKSYKANNWGLYDMHGNVWELVQDCYVNSYQGAPNDGSARNDEQCEYLSLIHI